MSESNPGSPQQAYHIRHVMLFMAVLLMTAGALRSLGRVFWCKCGGWSPWSWDIWSTHNSQHLIDPYFFSHVLHGFVFYCALHVCWKSAPLVWRFHAAMLIEAGWEILENSPIIINRYREATISLDYFGDSIANSMFDIVACALGFLLASRLKLSHSVAVFVMTELIMALVIKDSLILNVLMLVWPIDAIREWQMAQ